MSSSTLGRGLDSLIPSKKFSKNIVPDSSPVVSRDTNKVLEVPIENISPNPDQPRRDFSPEQLKGLADSIKEYGILQPLIVSQLGAGYQIIAGERRLRAAKLLRLNSVPCIVRPAEKHRQMELALIENLQRQDLNPIEQAVAFRRLIDEFNFTHEVLGSRLGVSRPYVSNILRLLNLPEDIQAALAKGEIPFTAGRTLAGIPPERQLEVFLKLKNGQITPTNLEVESHKVNVRRHVRKLGKDPNISAKEKELEAALGTRVAIKKSGSAGQVIIDFYSEEDLANLVEKLIT